MDTAEVVMSDADLHLVQHHRQQIAAEIAEHQRRRNAAVRSILMCKNLSYVDMIRTMKRNHEDDIKMMMDSQREEIEELKTSFEKEVGDLETRFSKDLEEEMRELQWTLEERLPRRVRELMEAIPVFDTDEVDAESAPVADVLELAGFSDTQAIREGADAVVEMDVHEVDGEEEESDESIELSSDSEDADGRANDLEIRELAEISQLGHTPENAASPMIPNLRALYRERLGHASEEDIERYLADLHGRLSASSELDTHGDIEDADEDNSVEENTLNHSFGSASTELVSDEEDQEVDEAVAAAAAAATREAIKTLREQNERCTSNAVRFSRICPICSDSPLHRAVFTSCGHSICLACAEEIKLVAFESEEIDLACPMCREEGGFVKLWEEREEFE